MQAHFPEKECTLILRFYSKSKTGKGGTWCGYNDQMENKLRVEFHCHTCYSKDSLLKPSALVKAARGKNLQRVVITDHNSIKGALEARQLAPDLVIVGEEIMTSAGELLAAFVQEEIPAGLSPLETIRRLREQKAFISVSHPFDSFRSGHWQEQDLLAILPFIDAIEIFNARCLTMNPNQRARNFAREHALSGTAGSDAHTAWELGRAALVLDPFSDAEGLKKVLRLSQEKVQLSSPLVHFTSRYATLVKKLGWVRWAER